MHEVRVESLEKLESLGGEVWISANSSKGDVNIVFPKHVWEEVLSKAQNSNEPDKDELEELNLLKNHLEAFAKSNVFETILEDVPCPGEGSDLSYDLVLRSPELYAITTGYFFAPTIERETVEEARAALAKDDFIEQAYLIGAVAGGEALASGDDNLKVVSARGRKSTASRFEMAPELWRVLSEKLGWSNMETIIPEDKNIKENKG